MKRRSRQSPNRPPRVSLISLGCPKNQVDSENLLGALADAGVVLCPDPADADIVIVNTCGFILPARDECRQLLGELIERKRRPGSPLRRIAIVGCWVERERNNLPAEFSEVDRWVGLLTPERMAALAEWVGGGSVAAKEQGSSHVPLWYEGDRPRIGLPHVAYLRISDGCINRCSYCTIPSIRGPLRSKLIETILAEGQEFARQGAQELILVGQDLANFGRDRGGKSELPQLVAQLDREIDVPWIRLMYLHPAHVNEELLVELARSRRLVHYLDVPLQHISDRLLAAMNRRVTRGEIEALIQRLRQIWPDLVLRTTFIVGFPGETEAEFEELLSFVRRTGFARMGAFQYYAEADTRAADMPQQVPQPVRAERLARLMQAQQEISLAQNRALVGRVIESIVDFRGEDPGTWIGRTYGDAPDVDGTILFSSPHGRLTDGRIVQARVTDASAYDLSGSVDSA